MVNPGGPSRACRRCRKLKVKCDENKPSCQRCHRGGHDCLYRDAFDCFHRDQNAHAKSIAVKKWRQRADSSIREDSLSRGLIISDSLYQLAYGRFCYDFALYSSMVSSLQNLPGSSPDSCLSSAVAAVSYANYHGRCKSQEAYEAGSIHYGRTLQKLAFLIPNTAEMQRDEVLMVMLLLGMYETLTSTTRDGSWTTHMQGTESILAHRENNSLSDGNKYFLILCIHLAIYYLQATKAPPLHFDSWLQQIPSQFSVKRELLGLMSRTASICAKITGRCSSGRAADSNGFAETNQELLKSAQTLDMQLTHWAAELQSEWAHMTQYPINVENRPSWARELFSIPGAPKYIYVYQHSVAASDWNMYRATRIRLNLALLELLSSFSFPLVDTPALKDRGFGFLLTLAGETASTIPYSIELTPDGSGDPATTDDIHSLSAYMVFFPSNTSFLCFTHPLMKDKDHAQRATWFKHVLLFLRDVAGISKAQAILVEESAT